MKQDFGICSQCPYYKRGYVQGYGDPNAKLMFIGEAPGMDESFRSHRPFTGPAGDELTRFLKGIDIDREDIYLTNLVKCNPPNNEDPKQEVIAQCGHYLVKELEDIAPSVIVTLGAIPLRYFNPKVDIEMVWGIPQETSKYILMDGTKPPAAVFPLYHPARGLHQTRMLPMIEEGFRRLGRWLSGEEVWEKDTTVSDYNKSTMLSRDWDTFADIAVDTETTWDGDPLYIQWSGKRGTAVLHDCGDPWVKGIKQVLEHPDLITVLHNTMFDLEVLHQLDIHPTNIEDTMVMAYLLGDLPQGLKPLAYRLCGMEMKEYEEVVGGYGQEKARQYLTVAVNKLWPEPEDILEWKKAKDGIFIIPHIKKPQNIIKKIIRALTDAGVGKVVHCKKDTFDVLIDRTTKWGNPFTIGRDGTREEVIEKHKKWLLTQKQLMKDLSELTGKTLGCWCKPASCHGDTLIELANSKRDVDLQERWHKMKGKEVVERELGPMPHADLRDMEEQEALTYACKDADATRRIYPILKKRIEDEGLQEAYEMDIGIIPMLLEMQRNGITVDRGALVKVGTAFAAQMQGKERELQKAIGYRINPGSSQQVAEMMDKRGIIGRKRRGKSGLQSTGVEILEPLRTGYPEIGLILDWRKYETLMSMFVDVIPTMIHSDGKVHTTIKNTHTITGRLAMEEPNLQQQPVRTEESRLIRNAFVASPGYVLASFDYSQIELRVAAHESQDEVMLSIFHRGEDIHSSTASRMFGIPIGELNDERHRRPAKTVNFGILYGISPIGLMLKMETEGANTSARIAGQPILWTEGACSDMIASWLSIFRGVKDWREEIKAHARRYGWVADMFGRRRLTPEVHSTSKKIVEEGLRYAMNQPVQSGAQGIIKKAMVKMWGEFLTQLPVGVIRPLLQIHDDLLFEYREGEEWVLPIIQEMMETTVKLSILISVELKVGEKWGSMKKST